MAFRKAKDECRSDYDVLRVFDKHSAIATAYDIWGEQSSSSGHSKICPVRYEIEARLLANEDVCTVAESTQIDAEVIEAYEKLFFNVCDKLNSSTYILHVAIGDAVQRGMTDRDYHILWKLYAFVRGSKMLEFLMYTFTDMDKATNAHQVDTMLAADYRSNMRRKAALSARMMGVNNFTQDRLIELQTKIVEIEKAAGDDSAPDEIAQSIQTMFSKLPFLTGEGCLRSGDKRMVALSKTSGDLRADELLRLSMGETLDTNTIDDFKIPEKSNGSTAV